MLTKEQCGYAALITAAVVYGVYPFISKWLNAEGINVYTIISVRSWLAIPLLYAICRARGIPRRGLIPAKGQIPGILLVSLLSAILTPFLLWSSYDYISSGMATTVHYIYPTLVVLGCWLILRQKLSSTQLICAILGLVGVSMFYVPSGIEVSFLGITLALLSGFAYAGYVISASTKQLDSIPAVQLIFYMAIVCGVSFAIWSVFFGGLTLPKTGLQAIVLVFASLLTMPLCTCLFQIGIHYVGPQRASILSLLEPLTSIVVGCAFFHESLTTSVVIGCIFVLSSVVFLTASKKAKAGNE